MLYYPLNPRMFVKRVIARESGYGAHCREDASYVNDIPLHDEYVRWQFRSHDDWGPQVIQQPGYYFVMGPSEQQLRQPPLGSGAERSTSSAR